MPPVSSEHQQQHQHDQPADAAAASGSTGTDTDADAGDREVPLVATIAPVVDEVIDIAREHLEDPISVKLRTWQDNTFQVDVRHSYGRPHRYRYHRRAVVRYHSEEEVVEGALLEEDRQADETTILHRETLATIESPTEKNAAWMSD